MTKISPSFLNGVVDLACALQQIPSPTFAETRKADYIFDTFLEHDLQAVQRDDADNVFACLPGETEGRPLVITAHMDTVHPLSGELPLLRERERITGPSIGDNSLGVACLFGLARYFRENKITLPNPVWLVANVCEEGLGDLRGMQSVVDHFGSHPLAYVVVEGMGLGQIYHRALGVERYRVNATTAGGHSWVDYGKPSAIHTLAEVVVRIANLPLPKSPRTTLNVGIIQGGTSINTIAGQASFDLDLRSEDQATLRSLSHQVRRIVENANTPGARVQIEPIGLRPSGNLPAAHPLVQLAVASLKQVGVEPNLEIASTDANIPLSRGLPAVCIGMTTGANAHTRAEYIDLPPLAQGFAQLAYLVRQVWRLPL